MQRKLAETVELICPNVTARRDDGEATYGGIERTFDTVLLRSKDDSSQTSRQTVVLPSQIECTHPSASKFHSGKTRVTCMWTASPDIHCEFWVTRGARTSYLPDTKVAEHAMVMLGHGHGEHCKHR